MPKSLKKNSFDFTEIFNNLLIFVVIVLISSCSIFSNNYPLFFITIFFFFYAVIRNGIKLNGKFLFLTIAYLLINTLVLVNFSLPFYTFRIINGYIIMVFLPYLVLKIFGLSFWGKFEKTVYILTCISLPLFLLNVIFPSFFIGLTPYFKVFTNSIFYDFSYNSHYWTSLIYVHLDKSDIIDMNRNSGFMWEPGAFAWMIVLCMSINWIKSGVNYNRKSFIYLVALITTFSTSGYIAGALLMAISFIAKKKFVYFFLLIPFLLFSIPYLSKLEFVGQEIRDYTEAYKKDKVGAPVKLFNATKLNRFQIVKYQVRDVMHYPLGYGVYRTADIAELRNFVGVNGLSNSLFTWGVPFFIFLMVYLWRFFVFLDDQKKHIFFIFFIFFISNLVMLFSNNITYNPIFYLMIFTPLLLKSNKVAKT